LEGASFKLNVVCAVETISETLLSLGTSKCPKYLDYKVMKPKGLLDAFTIGIIDLEIEHCVSCQRWNFVRIFWQYFQMKKFTTVVEKVVRNFWEIKKFLEPYP
jgi:hypothetical protein